MRASGGPTFASGKVAVIGSNGYLGSSICRKIGHESRVQRLVRTIRGPGELRYDFWRDDLAAVLRDSSPKVGAIVFAARVHPIAQADDHKVMRDYVARIRRLIEACSDRLLLVVSTDAVFRGDRGCYEEDETPEPTSAYGRCALLIETLVEEMAERWCIVRPSYIYGIAAVGLDKRLQAARMAAIDGKPFTVYPEMFRSPIEVNELAEAIRDLISRDVRGIVHAAGPRTSVADFFAAGLTALGYRTDTLKRQRLPNEIQQIDTSLQVRRLLIETSVIPNNVPDALHRVLIRRPVY